MAGGEVKKSFAVKIKTRGDRAGIIATLNFSLSH